MYSQRQSPKTVVFLDQSCVLVLLAAGCWGCRCPDEDRSPPGQQPTSTTRTPPSAPEPLTFDEVKERLADGRLLTGAAPSRDTMKVLVEGLCRDRELKSDEELVESVLPIARHFTPADAARLVAHDRVPTTLLGLLALSLRGERAALDELIAISVEYGGDLALFVRSLKQLFPAGLNPGLYHEDEPEQLRKSPFAFLQEIRAAAAGAQFHAEPPAGWRLHPTP